MKRQGKDIVKYIIRNGKDYILSLSIGELVQRTVFFFSSYKSLKYREIPMLKHRIFCIMLLQF